MGTIRIRVSMLVIDDGRILLVRHEKDGRSYWLLPGGGLEYGESLEEALRREAEEETGLDIEVRDLVLVWESLPPNRSRHGLNLCFRASVRGGTLETRGDDRLREAAFVPLTELDGLPMHPPLAEPIHAIVEGARTPLFLGPRWTE
jgi:ADP-ribose pyrophosphatase YjhB (NUDIX family)